MANRTISVTLIANVQEYRRRLREAGDETRRQADTAERALRRQREAMDQVGRGAVLLGATAAAAFVAMVKASSDFEQRMSQVQAVSKATSSQMNQLRSASFSAGKAFGLSATEVADAEIELTKAGVSVKDVLGGALPGALALAAAGQLDVGKATEIASNAMTEFKLRGSDVPHVADLLAASADKSVASVESVGDALNQSGLVAAQFGLSIEDTVGTLTAFSKAGLNGSDAGTSFKTMLLSLASPSEKAQKTLDAFNITTYDSEGRFVGITKLADNLRKGLSGVSQEQRNLALSTIFGTDAIRSASTLYELGGKKLQGYIDANNEAGFAAAQAAAKLDNLNGDVQKLGAAFQNDLISSGSSANDALRGIAQTGTGLLTVLGDIPRPIQGVGVALTGAAAAVGLVGGVTLLAAPRILAAKAAMMELGLSGRTVALGIGKGSAALIGITALASGLANLGAQGEVNSAQLEQAALRIRGSYKDIDKAFPSNGVFDFGAGGAKASLDNLTSFLGVTNRVTANFVDGATAALTFGQAGTHLGDVFKSNQETFAAIGQQLAGLAHTDYSAAGASFKRLVDQLGGGGDAARAALQQMPAYREEIIKLLGSTKQAANEQNILAAATGYGGVAGKIREAQAAAAANQAALARMSGAASDAQVDISKLSDTIKGFGSVTLDARSAERDFQAAVDDAAASVKQNKRTLDTNTAAGRANQAALDNIASSAFKASAAILEQSGSQDDAAAAVRRGRKAFIDAAVQMGLSQSAAKKLADQLNLIPANVKTAVSVTGAGAASANIDAVAAKLRALDGRTASVAVHYAQTGQNLATGGVRFAEGGSITGPGPKGKDSVAIWAAPGEHVLTAREVDRMGGQGAVYAFRQRLMAYADGGAIEDAKRGKATAKADVARYTREVKAAEAAEKRLQKVYDGISGKEKDRARKKAAKDRLDTAEDKTKAAQKRLDDAKDRRDNSDDRILKLQQDREDFVSSQRRGGLDPLGYVDQLRSMSRDTNFSQKRRDGFDKAANAFEAALYTLGKQSDEAASKLSDLKSSADSMRSSLTSSIAGGYQLGNVSTSMTPTLSGWVVRNGVRFRTTGNASTSISADAVDRYYSQGAGESAAFAAKLKRLAAMGVDARLLAELAGKGVTEGGPYADALLSATSAQIGSINAGYAAIQDNAAAGAAVVTDANYKALIDSAQANADQITKQIASDSDKLRKLIATAFGVSGYAVGTKYAAPGWHWTGENGRELVNFGRGGGQVLNPIQTRYALAGTSGSAQPPRDVRVTIPVPTQMNLIDADGHVIGRMRTEAAAVAEHVVDTRNHAAAVALLGGATR